MYVMLGRRPSTRRTNVALAATVAAGAMLARLMDGRPMYVALYVSYVMACMNMCRKLRGKCGGGVASPHAVRPSAPLGGWMQDASILNFGPLSVEEGSPAHRPCVRPPHWGGWMHDASTLTACKRAAMGTHGDP